MSELIFATLIPGAVFNGRYRIIRSLKAGGMGAVFEVFDMRIDAPRALKVMLPSLLEDPDFRERFAREAKFAGSIQSDHIVRISDAGVDEATGTPFIVMELLDGEELAKLAKRRQPLPHHEIVTYLSHTALGLDKAHAKGIVHRDLKPENLFVTMRDDGTSYVKILDFGIAKAAEQSADARATRPMGTPPYMAPEQVRGEGTIGPRADVYALAQVAYALLAGEPYWTEEAKSSDSLFLLWTKIMTGVEERPVVRAQRRQGVILPAPFDAWFMKATAVKPADRFDRATVCIAALADALGVRRPMPSALELVGAVGAGRAPMGSGDGSRAVTTGRIDRTGPGEGRTTQAVTNEVVSRRGHRSRLAVASAIVIAVAVMVAAFAFLRRAPDVLRAAATATALSTAAMQPSAARGEATDAPSASTTAPAVSASGPPVPTVTPTPQAKSPRAPRQADRVKAVPTVPRKDTIE